MQSLTLALFLMCSWERYEWFSGKLAEWGWILWSCVHFGPFSQSRLLSLQFFITTVKTPVRVDSELSFPMRASRLTFACFDSIVAWWKTRRFRQSYWGESHRISRRVRVWNTDTVFSLVRFLIILLQRRNPYRERKLSKLSRLKDRTPDNPRIRLPLLILASLSNVTLTSMKWAAWMGEELTNYH